MNMKEDRVRKIFENRSLHLAILFFLNIVINSFLSLIEKSPGYMDAEYYYSGAFQISHGYGFNEKIIWNFLDNPGFLPHPSHLYWMPLPSILGAIGMFITGTDGFLASRIMFIFLSGFIPVLTYMLAFSYRRNTKDAILAGMISLFSGYYLVYTGNTETFTPYMVFASLFFALAFTTGTGIWENKYDYITIFILGILTGLLHLTRTDGVIWFVCGLFLLIYQIKISNSIVVGKIIVFTVGYLIIMFPWFYRNLTLFGSLFSPGASSVMWLTNYDQLFSHPATGLTFQNWISSGWQNIIKDRLAALWMNIKNILAVQTQIYLLPLIILGFFELRKLISIRFVLIMWLLNFALMTLIFPYAGSRGGFIHSGAALQPVIWSVIPVGLEKYIKWGQRHRGWKLVPAWSIFSGAIIIFGTIFSIFVFRSIVIGNDSSSIVWTNSEKSYQQIEYFLNQNGADKNDIVLVNNPAGYFAVNKRPSIVIPDGNFDTLINTAGEYHAKFVIFEINHVKGMADLFHFPRNEKGITYIGEIGDSKIFRFMETDN